MLLVSGHKVLNRLFQAVEGQFEHGEYLTDYADDVCISPFLLGLGIEPDGLAEGFGENIQKLQDRPHFYVLLPYNTETRFTPGDFQGIFWMIQM